jgi:hypothetical protein
MSKKSGAFLRGVARSNSFLADRFARSGWLRLSDLPIRTTFARKLIALGILESVLVASPGAKRGIRLVSVASFDRYVRQCAKEQGVNVALEEVTAE